MLPVLSHKILRHNPLNFVALVNEDFLKRYGTLYDQTRYYSIFPESLWTVPFFCVRRLLVCFSVVFSNEFLVLQLAIYLYGIIFVLGFLMRVKPMQGKLMNYAEIMNEMFVLVTFYHCVLFFPGLVEVET